MLKTKKFALLILLLFSSTFVFAQEYDPVAYSRCLEIYSEGMASIGNSDFGASECEAMLLSLPVLPQNPTQEEITIHEITTSIIWENFYNCDTEVEVRFQQATSALADAIDDCFRAAEIP